MEVQRPNGCKRCRIRNCSRLSAEVRENVKVRWSVDSFFGASALSATSHSSERGSKRNLKGGTVHGLHARAEQRPPDENYLQAALSTQNINSRTWEHAQDQVDLREEANTSPVGRPSAAAASHVCTSPKSKKPAPAGHTSMPLRGRR